MPVARVLEELLGAPAVMIPLGQVRPGVPGSRSRGEVKPTVHESLVEQGACLDDAADRLPITPPSLCVMDRRRTRRTWPTSASVGPTCSRAEQ